MPQTSATAAALAPLIDTGAGTGRHAPLPVLAVLAAGGAAFGLFTAAVFTLVLAGVRGTATSSVSGLLPTAQQLGGSIGVGESDLGGATFWFELPLAVPASG